MTESAGAEPSEATEPEGQWPHVVNLLADDERPIEVGQFEICEQGRIARRSFELPLEFSFVYEGGRYDCRVDLAEEESVQITADLARLPYTAESPRGRQRALRLLSATGLLSSGRLKIADGGWIRYEGRKAPPRPCTPACVMASVVALMLELKPTTQLLRLALGAERIAVPAN